MVLPAPAGGEDLTPGFVPDAGDARPEPDAEADEDAFPDEEPPFGFPDDLPPLVDLALGFIVGLDSCFAVSGHKSRRKTHKNH